MTANARSTTSHLNALVEASAALAALPTGAGPAAVLDILYQRVRLLFGIRDFLVSLYDRESGLIRCGYAVVDGKSYSLDEFAPLPLGAGPTSRVIRTGRPVIVGDALAERAGWRYREVGDTGPVRSMLLAPMTRGGEVVGVVQAQSARAGAFSADDAAALSVLATQAAAALEAIRGRDQAERATARARLLDDVSRLTAATLDLPAVLQTLAEQVTLVMGAACAVYLLTESGDAYESRMIHARDPRLQAGAEALLRQRPLPLTQSVIGGAILRGRPVLVPDIQQAGLPADLVRPLSAVGIRQAILAPIRRDDRVLGAILVVGTPTYPLGDDDLQIATAVAGRAAAAVEHARLHAEVTEQRRFLAQLIEAAPIGIAVLRGEEHVFEFANAAYRQRMGDDIVSRPFVEVARRRGDRYARAALRSVQRVSAEGQPLRMSEVPSPSPHNARERISFDLSPLPAERGRPAGVLLIVWDVTAEVLARERLEQLARQSRAHAAELEAIIAGMAEGVIVTDGNGVVRLLNEAGRQLLENIPAGGPAPVWDWVERFSVRRLDGTPVSRAEIEQMWRPAQPVVGLESLMRLADGSDRVLHTSIAPLPGADGAPAGAVAIFEDVTERKALEDAREEFLAQASHELRTPLTSLLAYLQIASRRLGREPGVAAPVVESVERGLSQAQRLRELVNDLLDATRIRRGRLELRKRLVDLGTLVAEAVDETREGAPRELHTIRLDLPECPVVASWDPERLRQVVLNLLDNAIKYSPAGCEVVVRLRTTADTAVLSVQDAGIGIPARDLPKLFRPFGRAEHAAARNIPGFGLGLYICRDIVERHGGTIIVRSRQGHGTTVTVTLPRGESAAGGASQPEDAAAGPLTHAETG